MAVTPLIKPVQDKKGIFYNFQSALEDINITLSNSENAVRFSKFALLRIPEIGTPNTLATDNKIQFGAAGESPILEGLNPDNNVNLAESFQNYALNLESLLLSRPSYKKSERLTISERVFWKWLKELGAIRFQDANALEKNTAVLLSDPRFVEKPETSSTYNRVVKYIGDIDVVNTLSSSQNSYTEVYIHVPTNVGTTPHVLFKSVEDPNYKPSLSPIANTGAAPLDVEYLSGRHYNDTHPFGLSLKAFYDLDDASVTAEIKNTLAGPYAPGNWFPGTINNSYYLDSTFNIAQDQFIRKTQGATVVEYQRTTLDGISLDFDLANYKLASENPEIKVFSQFNDYVANRDFEFNAVLVYYDTYDPNNLDSNGNPIDFKTNLYGILFLDKIQQSGLEFAIPPISKYKPDPLSKTNGNSFSFKLNLKLDTSIEDAKVEKSINDYSTFSLELFTDVLTKFTQLQTSFSNKLLELDQLQQEVLAIKDLLINTVDSTEIGTRITNLETSLIANQAIFSNTGDLVTMIENTNSKINSIIAGDTNIVVSYDLNGIRPGEGIYVDRSTPNRVRIINANQQYNIANGSITNIFTGNTLTLGTFTNYFVHQNSGAPIILGADLSIYINDTTITWKKGQVLRLVFDDELIPGIFDLKIYTDALNRNNTGVYGVAIGLFNDLDFTTSLNKPIFDIICLDDVNFTFRVDKIR
ncbi:hypothetical protein UFOVP1247_289 [uncultured Caudovirales phage]|uniref:Uncharacterized protein n=1 Tax=uncultured Caudovirales phage TaxID=2100421 RepID=A0A6J5RJM2_9CAUD|nr:hypothetical protein UFOVP970_329 [uncultured Caudovirales phage]CAB4193918.1 hypothetical protein UFOVP1247_289 [uncultured Caudovirales phage]